MFFRGRPFAAGLIAAVAACVKVTPALLIVYFVYKGASAGWGLQGVLRSCRARVLAGALAGGIACLLLWPALSIGWLDNLRLLGEWREHMLSAYLTDGSVRSSATNQSLVAVLNRLLGQSVALRPDVYLTLVQLPDAAVSVIRLALSAALLGGLARVFRRRFEPQTPPLAKAAELSLVLIAMLVLSGYTWKAHYVAMLLPYSVLLAYLADARYPDWPRRWIAGLLATSFALVCLSGEIVTPYGADLMLGYGVILYSGLVAATGVFLVHKALTARERTSCHGATVTESHALA
jgi:hypothetical protein